MIDLSKSRLLLAVMLVALAICISGCGDNNDTGATSSTASSEKSTEPLASQASEIVYTPQEPTDKTVSDKGSAKSSSSDNGAEEKTPQPAKTDRRTGTWPADHDRE